MHLVYLYFKYICLFYGQLLVSLCPALVLHSGFVNCMYFIRANKMNEWMNDRKLDYWLVTVTLTRMRVLVLTQRLRETTCRRTPVINTRCTSPCRYRACSHSATAACPATNAHQHTIQLAVNNHQQIVVAPAAAICGWLYTSLNYITGQ